MLLTIESSINFGSISLMDEKAEIGHHIFSEFAPLSSTLIIEIKRLLENNGVEKSQIKQILVSNGPGSLTGLRVGIGVGKSFANSLGIECFGVNIPKGVWGEINSEIAYLILPFGYRKVFLQEVVNKSFTKHRLIDKSELKNKLEFKKGSLLLVESSLVDLINLQKTKNKVEVLGDNLAGLLGKNFLKAQRLSYFDQTEYNINPKYLEF